MKSLVFDTETTGFPINSVALNDPAQPHLIQVAAILSIESMILAKFQTIIHCPIEVPEGAFKIHGISKEKSNAEGISLPAALTAFNNLASQADRVVAHNTVFDIKMLRIAYARAEMESPLHDLPKACTMKTVTPLLRRLGKRWTLDSSYRHFVDSSGFSDAHDAMADTMACFKLMNALKEKNIELVTL